MLWVSKPKYLVASSDIVMSPQVHASWVKDSFKFLSNIKRLMSCILSCLENSNSRHPFWVSFCIHLRLQALKICVPCFCLQWIFILFLEIFSFFSNFQFWLRVLCAPLASVSKFKWQIPHYLQNPSLYICPQVC